MTRLTATKRRATQRSTNESRTPRLPIPRMLPIPTGGLDAISPITSMPPQNGIRLDNWFPQLRYIEVRRGNMEHCDTGAGDMPVETLAPYNAAISSDDKMFAAVNGSIFDVTTDTPSEVVTLLVNDRWQYVNFATSAAQVLYMVNGADAPLTWDGSAWTNPAITGVDETTFVNIAVFKERLWFVATDSLSAWFLPVDSIAGAATEFRLGGIVNEGGFLMAIATWSIEGGDGPDDRIAFITSRGEVAVYEGVDPTDPTDFRLIGVYKIGAPIGRRCWTKIGGEVGVICQDGIVPLSRAMVIDRGEATSVVLTANIQPLVNDAVQASSNLFGWQFVLYPLGTRAILNIPELEGETQYQFVINTISGAWCRFLGQHANCWVVFQDRLFFGGNDGIVYEADVGGTDNGQTIVADMETSFTDCEDPLLKHFHLVRPFLNVDGGESVSPTIAINTDFRSTGTLNATDTTTPNVARWDDALWDVDEWPETERLSAAWQGVTARVGNTVSVRLVISSQSEGGDDFIMQLLAVQIAYTRGAIV